MWKVVSIIILALSCLHCGGEMTYTCDAYIHGACVSGPVDYAQVSIVLQAIDDYYPDFSLEESFEKNNVTITFKSYVGENLNGSRVGNHINIRLQDACPQMYKVMTHEVGHYIADVYLHADAIANHIHDVPEIFGGMGMVEMNYYIGVQACGGL